jgi:denticleless
MGLSVAGRLTGKFFFFLFSQALHKRSFFRILHYWDLRSPTRRSRSIKPRQPQAVYTSTVDPTTLRSSRRSRGITSLALGTGPTAGFIFALGADSRIHTYEVPTLEPLNRKSYTHNNLQAVSFYVKLGISPCGRWLATGCGGNTGSKFLFDVSDVSRTGETTDTRGIELRGQSGEVGALDWADGSLATCADDGTVRVWRPNVETYRSCLDDSEASWLWSWEYTDAEHH